MIVVLFDIDMTLLDPAGAGRSAMTLAFEEMFGIADGLAEVPFAGRTDRFILRSALVRHGRLDGAFDELVPAFAQRYAEILAETLPRSSGRPLPGARDAVALLALEPNVRVGLATGNFKLGALQKLRHHGLADHLGEGGFGDEHIERRLVVADAIARLANRDGCGPPPPRHVFVVGDTRHDIEAAKANGCTAIGVGTGHGGMGELTRAGADMAFADLGDPRAFLRAILEASARG